MARNLRGFSFIEIIVASVLMSLTVIGLSATFIWTQKRNTILELELQAQNFDRELLDELLLTDYHDPILDIGTYSYDPNKEQFFDLPKYTESKIEYNLIYNLSGQRSYSVSELKEGISTIGKQITVIVSWVQEGQPKQEALYGLVIE